MNDVPPPHQPGLNIPPPPGGYPPGPPGRPGGTRPQRPDDRAPAYSAHDPYAQPPPQVQRRSGCRGCFFGCLIACCVMIAIVGIVGVAGVFMVKSMFPSDLSFGDAASCAVMRTIVNNADSIIDSTESSAADKAEMRRGVQELRTEYERRCGVQRLY